MRFAPSFAPGRRDETRESEHDRPAAPGIFPGPILLATDGSTGADGAVALTAHLARGRNARLQVVTVVEPATGGVIAGAIRDGEPPVTGGDVQREEQCRAVRAQLARHAAGFAADDLRASVGLPASVIVAEAAAIDASLLALGLRPHSLLDRVFRDETTLHVMRRASVPVVGVPPVMTELPKRAVVGVDFSISSLYAARAALPLLDDEATLYLAHVEPSHLDWDGGMGDDPLLTAALPSGFARFRDLLHAPPRLRIEQVVLDGENFQQLDDFATRVGAQLVALGTIRRSEPLPRGGRLREAFVRAAGVAVLVGPPAARIGILED